MELRHRRWAIWWKERSFGARCFFGILALGLLGGLIFAKPLYHSFKAWRAEQLLAKAEVLFQHPEPAEQVEAWRALQAAVQLAPTHYPVARRYAEALLHRRSQQEARVFWEFLVSLPETTDDDRVTLIGLLLNTGDLPAARDRWNALRPESKKSEAASELEVRLLAAEGDTANAIARLRELVDRFPGNVRLQRARVRHLARSSGPEAARAYLEKLASRPDAVGLMACRHLAWGQIGSDESISAFATLRDHPLANAVEREMASSLANGGEVERRDIVEALESSLDSTDSDDAQTLAQVLWKLGTFEAFDRFFPSESPSDVPQIAQLQLLRLRQAGDFAAMRQFISKVPSWPQASFQSWVDLEEALANHEETRATVVFDRLLTTTDPTANSILLSHLDSPLFAPWRNSLLQRLARQGGIVQQRAEAMEAVWAYQESDNKSLERLIPRLSLDGFRHLSVWQNSVVYLKLLAVAPSEDDLAILEHEARRLARLQPDRKWPRFLVALAALRQGDTGGALEQLAQVDTQTPSDLSPPELLILAAVLIRDPSNQHQVLRRTVEALPLRSPERRLWNSLQIPAANQAN